MQPNRRTKFMFTFACMVSSCIWFAISCRARRDYRETIASMPIEISTFDVRVDGKGVTIRNTSEYTLDRVWIDYEAEFDNGRCTESESIHRWRPGGEVTIVFEQTNGPVRLKAFRFNGWGHDKSHIWVDLKFSTTFDPPVKLDFQAAADGKH